jgi:hypothetical protein
MKFKVIKISPHSTGYKQIELIEEAQFSAANVVQQICTSSMMLPEAKVNFKEGDIIEINIEPAK